MMERISAIVLATGFLLLAGCQHQPTPHSSASLPTVHRQPASISTRLLMPIRGIKPKQLKDTWGEARSAGRRHEGIDIFAPRDTPVFSTCQGRVGSLKSNALGGTVVWVAADDGSWHYYAHLERQAEHLKVGDKVARGQVIGYVGNSGNARGGATHLHYAIYLEGRGKGAVNPYLYLR